MLLAPRYEAEPARCRPRRRRALRAGGRRPRRAGRGGERRCRARPSPAAAKTIEATYETPPQYHNAMEPHAIVARMGRRPAVDRHADPGPRHGARARSPACSASRRRTSTSAAPSSAAASAPRACPPGRRCSASWPRKMVGTPVKLVLSRAADVRPGRPSRPDPPDAAPRHRRRRRPRPRSSISTRGPDEQVRRFRRALRQCLPLALCQPGDPHQASKPSASISARPASCARRARLRARRRWRAPSTRRPSRRHGSRWSSGSRNYAEVEPISGKPFSSKALRECYAKGADRFGWAKRSFEPRSDARQGGPACRLGRRHGAVSRRHVPGQGARGDPCRRQRRDRDRGARHGPGRLDGARIRSPPTGSACRWRRPSSAPDPPTFPMPASPAAPATRRPRASPCTRPART